MKFVSIFLLMLWSFTSSFGQIMPSGHEYAKEVTPEKLHEFLSVLASDEYEGRETGQFGQRKAAEYISKQFESFGMPAVGENNTYLQEIAFYNEKWVSVILNEDGKRFKHLTDFYAFPGENIDRPNYKTKKVYFLGYGIDDAKYSDYKGKNYKDKTILIYSGEPKNANGNFLVSGSSEASDWSNDINKKLAAAKKHGVGTVLIIDPDIKKNIANNRVKILGGRTIMGKPTSIEERVNHLYISSTVAKEIIGSKTKKVIAARDRINNQGKAKRVKLKSNLEIRQKIDDSNLSGSNVVGMLEGSDPSVKDEMVIVTAHYDHLGKRGESIFNGADDNGSGSSTVLNVAKAMMEAKKQGLGPRRSVLFMLVSGEEKGLLGSQYYVNHPLFPLENAVANVNVDMVGRVDEKYADNPEYIYVIGSDRLSTDLHDINEKMNTDFTNLTLDYTYNEESDPNRYYYRSDHYNFAKNNIPAIFFFNGTHKDYHRPSDTIEKINFSKMAKIGQLVYHTVYELANRKERIQVNVFDE